LFVELLKQTLHAVPRVIRDEAAYLSGLRGRHSRSMDPVRAAGLVRELSPRKPTVPPMARRFEERIEIETGRTDLDRSRRRRGRKGRR